MQAVLLMLYLEVASGGRGRAGQNRYRVHSWKKGNSRSNMYIRFREEQPDK